MHIGGLVPRLPPTKSLGTRLAVNAPTINLHVATIKILQLDSSYSSSTFVTAFSLTIVLYTIFGIMHDLPTLCVQFSVLISY